MQVHVENAALFEGPIRRNALSHDVVFLLVSGVRVVILGQVLRQGVIASDRRLQSFSRGLAALTKPRLVAEVNPVYDENHAIRLVHIEPADIADFREGQKRHVEFVKKVR